MRQHAIRFATTSLLFGSLFVSTGALAASAVATVFDQFMAIAKQTPAGALDKAADAAKARKFNAEVTKLANQLVPPGGDAIARNNVKSFLQQMQKEGRFERTLDDAYFKGVLDDVAAKRVSYTDAIKKVSLEQEARLKEIQGNYASVGGAPVGGASDAGHAGDAAGEAKFENLAPAKPVVASAGRDAAAADLRKLSESLSGADKQHYDDIIKETNQAWDEAALRGLGDTLRATDDYIKGAMRADLTKAIADAKAAGKTDEAARLQLILDKLASSPGDAAVRKYAAEAVLLKQGVPKDNVAKMMDCFR